MLIIVPSPQRRGVGVRSLFEDNKFQNWMTQFATSKSDKMGLRIAPIAFTEHGVLMLSSV